MPSVIALVYWIENGQTRILDRKHNNIVLSQENTEEKLAPEETHIEVYRALEDGIPLVLLTELIISASGSPREITVGQLLWDGLEVMEIDSPIPARIEGNGDITLQITPGEHVIHVAARYLENTQTFKTHPRSPLWPATEYLSFSSNSEFRQVQLTGANSIDTSQVDIPEDWSALPTYRLTPDITLTMTTEFRGNHSPAANKIAATRDLWLRFDGNGLIAREQLEGETFQDWRIDAQPDTQLGRAVVDEQPVLITEFNGQQGIEIRDSYFNLDAVTEIDDIGNFSATGWNTNTDSLTATLHTPPGWQVLHASGVSTIRGTWSSQWDLWDIFLVLIILATTQKLLGNKAAVLAAFTLILTYHTSGAPIALFAVLLLLLAILSKATQKILVATSYLCGGIFALLLLSIINFSVDGFRLAIYPSLEHKLVNRYGDSTQYTPKRHRFSSQSADITLAEPSLEEVVVTGVKQQYGPRYVTRDSDRVQTGPGLPTWLWNRTLFKSDSLVSSDTNISVIYSPPWATRLWRVLNIFLIIGFSLILAYRIKPLLRFHQNTHPNDDNPSPNKKHTSDDNTESTPASLSTPGSSITGSSTPCIVGALLCIALTALLSLQSFPSYAEEFPPQYLLEELKQDILQAPACLPHCVSLNDGSLTITEDTFSLTAEVYADTNIELPLPNGNRGVHLLDVELIEKETSHRRFLKDKIKAPLVRSKNALSTYLRRGHYQLIITGELKGDSASLSLPLPIHNFKLTAKGWNVEGIIDGRIPSGTLSFQRITASTHTGQSTLTPAPVKPFVKLKRTFIFDKDWKVETEVTRVAPHTEAFSISLPLLDNENPLSSHLDIQDKQVTLHFRANQEEALWTSLLQHSETIVLTAANTDTYVEVWHFLPSSLWRIHYEGIPPIKPEDEATHQLWRPWPGETLQATINRPSGIKGATYTIESADLVFQAGENVQVSKLELEIRASLGETFTFNLPDESKVMSLSHDNRSLNIPKDNEIRIPLRPGKQRVAIEFQQNTPIQWIQTTPQVALPTQATNIDIVYEAPRDRWTLYLTGPDLGPAMLYWGVLCVIILGAIALHFLARALGWPIPVTLLGWMILGLGLSTTNSVGTLIAALFFFAVAWKMQLNTNQFSQKHLRLIQAGMIFLTLITALFVMSAVPMGLLGSPEMKVIGNNSSAFRYIFYQDFSQANEFPTAIVVSAPMIVYRLMMLLWSLWLSMNVIRWGSWWWESFTKQ
ncbi:hypothetical protein [Marinibactrum halimedae]|uniref:Uncharacterized protein n=1 Tax=Marinibactrum halimedae TaxID=1444977 RepID=A0AA37T959_9GAMM|nr:hypothetical protein [Marinibactrum halimedae]MCD9460192.1 hypothetical protein [Marinibactrum halimedae]GLS27976.1 hypothetical protein GCM10007877_36950 [Marinibactrum halimedae]